MRFIAASAINLKMNSKIKQILDKTKNKSVGIFIDNANWFYPQKELKRKISFTKPLKKIWLDKEKTKFDYKCNFDVEIALDVARNMDKIDLVMIGSGDSDFLEVKKFTFEHQKGFLVLCFEKGVAWEVRKNYHVFLEDLQEFIARS